jgi:purine-binding chemotaxis protein CheW
MANKSYLVFNVMERQYAIDLTVVREMIDLPELTPVEEVPPFIAGVFKLRGNIIPVMDLNLLFGHSLNRYYTTDSVIVTERDGQTAGIIASELHDVVDIPDEEIQTVLARDPENEPIKRFIAGEARAGDSIVMVLDYYKLLEMRGAIDEQGRKQSSALRYFCTEAKPEERLVFRNRANGYSGTVEYAESTGRVPVVVIGLNGEFFGMEIDPVKEFTDIRGVVPVPDSPAHILGVMNLRGDILTLVDVRGVMHMPAVATGILKKAVVTRHGEDLIGIAVEDVLDLVYIKTGDITKVPLASRKEREGFIRGTARYAGQAMAVLDMEKIIPDDAG